MDEYLLDTNAVSNIFRARNRVLLSRSRSIPATWQFIPSVVRAELLYGWHSSPHHASRIAELHAFLAGFGSLAFDDAEADEYGKLRAYLSRIGLLIRSNDLMIASIALTHDLVLVTHNVGEFSRVPNLRIEYWESPAS